MRSVAYPGLLLAARDHDQRAEQCGVRPDTLHAVTPRVVCVEAEGAGVGGR
jgi:hypothetical protein